MPMTRYCSKQDMLLLLFSCEVMSDSLWPHRLQHTRLLCSSLSLRACSNSCPLSRWCYPTISSSVIPFSSCLQSFPASGSFPMNRLFASGGQSIGASASDSAITVNIQGWYTNKQAYRKMLNITIRKIQIKPQWDNTSHKQVRLATNKREKNKCWWRCGKIGILVHCWWEYKMVQPLW